MRAEDTDPELSIAVRLDLFEERSGGTVPARSNLQAPEKIGTTAKPVWAVRRAKRATEGRTVTLAHCGRRSFQTALWPDLLTGGGIGQASFVETITDAGTGRLADATFGDYLVPVNADVPDIDVVFVGEPDRLKPTGTKGIGEVGLAGTAPAIANAVYHATGRRIRSLPITIDQLL